MGRAVVFGARTLSAGSAGLLHALYPFPFRFGMHQPDLNALIRGRAAHVPTLLTLRRLAKGLGVHWVIDINPDGEVVIREESAQSERQWEQTTVGS